MLRKRGNSLIFEIQTRPPCRLWQHGQNGCVKRISGGELYQDAHLVGLVLLQTQTAHGDCHHHCHAAGDVQLHGSLAADEAVVEQEVASDACVDTLQGVLPGKDLLPFASAARTRTEDSQGMFSIVDLDANYTLLGLWRETAHAMAFVAPTAMQSVFHGRTSILQGLAVLLEIGTKILIIFELMHIL